MRSSDSHISSRPIRSLRYVLLAAIAAVMIFGYRALPGASASSDSVPIAAATTVSTEPEAYVLTREMLDLALNLRSVSEFTAFAERGIALNGVAEIKGSSGDGSRSVRGRKAAERSAVLARCPFAGRRGARRERLRPAHPAATVSAGRLRDPPPA